MLSLNHGFPGDASDIQLVNNQLANAGDVRDVDSIPGLGRSPGGENSTPLQYSCLGNPMDRGASWATAHEAKKSQTQLSEQQQQQLNQLSCTAENNTTLLFN